ncbi:hypothetical protein QBC32DRAFT_165017 [Pseudoneurospora amorphoporcata]|uniref:Uncharacterized protein n=1 Tax=Pseudoneurospora amorphoporcata TaxID=241081 RepID=A0AAN6SK09_9PEZI|nr:hypothetical protein QBC32DRAFT_165017 [Pseudoneurospora amorphoporcata]
MAPQVKKPLRQIAAEKLYGPNANPSQLGDPISLKSETSQDSPQNVEYTPEGAEVSPSKKSSANSNANHNRTKAYGVPRNDPAGGGKAATSSSGWGNPRTSSGKRVPLEGDPTSMEREMVVDDGRTVREEENGPVGRGWRGSSKL